MGLFSSNDKPCPICGGATPRMLAKKFDGQPICSKCADNISADSARVKSWSLAQLREHLDSRAANKTALANFSPTRTVAYEHEVIIDDTNGLFYIKQWTVDNPPIFRFSEITGFTIELDYQTVESWSKGMVRTPFRPVQAGIVGGIAALVEAFDDDKEKKNVHETLHVTLKINSPYLSEYELCDLSVGGNGQAAFAYSMSHEMSKVDTVCNLIVALASANAGTQPKGAPAAASATGTVDDIRKFKELFDAGVITEAEFDAKKKQLLGI